MTRLSLVSRFVLPAVLAASVSLVGCSEPASPVSLFGGFDYAWELLSHRISYLRATVGEPSADGGVDVRAGIVGGPFSLNPAAPEGVRYGLGWGRLVSDKVKAHYGSVELDIGPTGRAETVVSIDVAALPAADRYVVALQGLEFDTDVEQVGDFPEDYDPVDGWTPQVLGAGVDLGNGETTSIGESGPVDQSAEAGESLDLRLWLQFKAGPLDRADMNAALSFATIAGRLHYIVLAVNDAQITTGDVEAEAYYSISGSPYTEIAPIDESQRRLSLVGVPEVPLAVPLMHSFEIELNESLDSEGRYLRALAVEIETFDYSPDTGAAEVLLDAYCSHSSLIEEGDLEVQIAARIGLLQVADPDGSFERGSLEGAWGAGPFDLAVAP